MGAREGGREGGMEGGQPGAKTILLPLIGISSVGARARFEVDVEQTHFLWTWPAGSNVQEIQPIQCMYKKYNLCNVQEMKSMKCVINIIVKMHKKYNRSQAQISARAQQRQGSTPLPG